MSSSSHPLDQLLADQNLDQVISDCVTLVRDEVSSKKGLSGTVIKGGLKVIEKVKPNILSALFFSLLPSFVENLKPLHERFTEDHSSTQDNFAQFLTKNSVEVAALLLAVTDERAQKSKLGALVSVYRKLRPLAQDQIVQAVPSLARLLSKHGVS